MTSGLNDSEENGGVSMLLFHCLFNPDDSITHFAREFDDKLYHALPHLYAVCIAESRPGGKVLKGGFVLKSSWYHNEPGFLAALETTVQIEPALRALIGANTTFLPARLGISGSTPPTEDEMLVIMAKQHVKFSD